MDAALQLFWQRGFYATTLRVLQTTTGICQSSIYNAFGSKQGLLETVLDHYEKLLDREVLHFLDDPTEGLIAIDGFLLAFFHWVSCPEHSGCFLINIVTEDGGANACLRRRGYAQRCRVRAAIHDALAHAAHKGEIEAVALKARTDLLFGLVLGMHSAASAGVEIAGLRRLLFATRRQIQAWRKTPGAEDPSAQHRAKSKVKRSENRCQAARIEYGT